MDMDKKLKGETDITDATSDSKVCQSKNSKMVQICTDMFYG